MSPRKSISGSMIGGIKETQEMLEFCAKHQIFADCEVISASEVNRAFQQLGSNSAEKHRFVIDVKNTLISDKTWEVEEKICKLKIPHTVNSRNKIIGAPNTAGQTYFPEKDKFEASNKM